MRKQLTARFVDSVKKPGRFSDGDRLYLIVGSSGSKSWIFRFMRSGRSRDVGLGSARDVTLSEAREAAQDLSRLLARGGDPLIVQRAKRTGLFGTTTFKELAEQYIEDHAKGWRNPKTPSVWRGSFEMYVYPIIGSLPVAAVQVAHVKSLLTPVWSEMPETGRRVRSRVAAVLDSALALGLVQENPADWRKLKQLLPRPDKVRAPKNRPALAYKDVPTFVADLRKREGIAPQALQFLILTAARTSEVIGAHWPEIDIKAKLWTVPAERMKAGKPHRVPLSPAALRLLEDIPHEEGNPHVFPGWKRSTGLSNNAMLSLAKDMRPGISVHGFRSSFRTWAAEKSTVPREVAEAALAHAVGESVEVAYQRSDLFDLRRKLMADWARFIGKS